jgi:uncharacterized protein (TIGR02117 family)
VAFDDWHKILRFHLKLLTLIGLLLALLTACSAVRPADKASAGAGLIASTPVVIYVVKRSWHTDVGFDVTDLHAPLASLRGALPKARYLLFGFGDKHYLLAHGSSSGRLLGAVWPGEGLVLLTGLEATPEEAFAAKEVTRLTVTAAEAQQLEEFVWKTLASKDGVASSLAPGPYSDSFYYESVQRYSGLHTCNTWTAEALRAAGLPVRTSGVEFSGQVWRQVQRIKREEDGHEKDAPPRGDASHP